MSLLFNLLWLSVAYQRRQISEFFFMPPKQKVPALGTIKEEPKIRLKSQRRLFSIQRGSRNYTENKRNIPRLGD